jgi:hypothetical protein
MIKIRRSNKKDATMVKDKQYVIRKNKLQNTRLGILTPKILGRTIPSSILS